MSDFAIGVLVVGFAGLTWGLLTLCDWLLGSER